MYPEKPIYDIAGFVSVRGRDLVDGLVAQAAQSSPDLPAGRVGGVAVAEPDGRLRVGTDAGTVLRCGAMVLTGGIGTFTPRPLPAGEEFLGRGLAYFVPQLAPYAGADVVIVGGGDSALDWTLALLPIARSVTLVHRRRGLPRPRRHGAGRAVVGRDRPHRRGGHRRARRRHGRRGRGDGQGWGVHGAAVHARGGRARLPRRPRAAARVGPRAARQPPRRGRLAHAQHPAPRLRRRRHHRLRRQGAPDQRRLRRGGHRGEQRRRRARPGCAAVPGPLDRRRPAVVPVPCPVPVPAA